MRGSVPIWVREKPLPELPDREEAARVAKSARRQFRYAVNDDDLQVVLREVNDLLAAFKAGETDLDIRSFYLPTDQSIRDQKADVDNTKLIIYSELADLFGAIARSSKGKKLEPFVNKTYLADADRLASTYSRNLLAHLALENEIVRCQMKRLNDASLSTKAVATIIGEVRLLFQSASRDRRARAYNSLVSQLNKNREEMVSQFLELHMLRRMISEKAGYKNFYEYATRRVGLTDAFRSQIHMFRLLIQEYISPLAPHVRKLQWERLRIEEPEPWDLLYPADFGVPVLNRNAFPLDQTSIEACQFVCEAEVPIFREMVKHQALQISVLPTPDGDGSSPLFLSHPDGTRLLNAYVKETDQSFLLMESVPQELFVNTFFYETGSLLFKQSNAKKGQYTLPNLNQSLAVKVAGHSLAFLSQKAWNSFYGPMTTYAREYLLSDVLLQLPLVAALDEMEEFLAKARVSDMNVFQHAWSEIARRYRLPGTLPDSPSLLPLQDMWLFAPHVWAEPLSTITDAIALVTVLGTLPLGKQHQQLENCLLRLLNTEDGEEPTDRAREAGYPSPFEEETVRKSVFAIADFLAL